MVEQTQTRKPKTAAKPRKRFVGSKSAAPSKSGSPAAIANQIPDEILSDALLNQAIKQLPANYSFEIHKTVHHIRKNEAKMVALQMPEGLQMFACTIADIIERFTNALTVIMGDVTYGACCVDDYTAVALGCDMLVHYGHSCLVPIDQTTIKTLYIFVEIGIDSSHLTETIRLNFPNDRPTFCKQLLEHEEDNTRRQVGQKIGKIHHLQIEGPSTEGDAAPPAPTEPTRLALVSTIQFVAALQRLKEDLTSPYSDAGTSLNRLLCAESDSSAGDVSNSSSCHRLWTGVYDVTIPRSKPLSPGEILGCTAPLLGDIDALIYLGDGRFHLESIMIANPSIPAFRYDPYSKKITRELYNHEEMRTIRDDAVRKARKSITAFSQISDSRGIVASTDENSIWGIILGTLGRQGSFKQMQAITHQLSISKTNIPYIPILLSELSPAKLALFNPYISTFIQTACPRLSIDWGYAFDKPLLSPYETAVAVGQAKGWMNEEKEGHARARGGRYPMDFYEACSPWAVARTKSSYL